MNFTIGEIIVWLIVGGLVGSLAGMVVTFKKDGFGRWKNLGVGMGGALIGGAIFNLFNIDLGLGELKISFEDLVSAFVGSLLLVSALWWIRRKRNKSHAVTPTSEPQ